MKPELEIRLCDDADNRALLAETFPQLLELYDIFPKEIFRVDFIRPVYLPQVAVLGSMSVRVMSAISSSLTPRALAT